MQNSANPRINLKHPSTLLSDLFSTDLLCGFLIALISFRGALVATLAGAGSWPQGPEVGPIPTPREGEHSARTASTPAAWNTRLCALRCSWDLTTHLSLGPNPTSQFPCLCTLRTVRGVEPGKCRVESRGGSRGDIVHTKPAMRSSSGPHTKQPRGDI